MHNRPPEEAGKGDIINIILEFWEASVARVQAAGVPKESIILDPGLGFGKIYEENWEVMRKLPALGQAAGYPLLLGASRKSMLAQLLEIKNPKERLHGTLGTTAWAVQAGIDFIRVHDVRENRECVKVIEHCQNYAADTD
jgi:dihydropteroate synthase